MDHTHDHFDDFLEDCAHHYQEEMDHTSEGKGVPIGTYKNFVSENRKTGYAIAATSTAIGAIVGYNAIKELASRDKAENTSVAKPIFRLAVALGAIALGGYTAVTMHR